MPGSAQELKEAEQARLRETVAGLNIQVPTDADFDRVLATQKAREGATSETILGNVGEGVKRLHTKRQEQDAMFKRLNLPAWSVVSMLPWPLNINGVLHRELADAEGNQIPACPVGEKYVQKIIYNVAYAIKDEGAGMDSIDNYTPVPFEPGKLAEEYFTEFNAKYGGIMIYAGTEPPTSPGLKKVFDEAIKRRNEKLRRLYQQAQAMAADTSGQNMKNITQVHRMATEVLLHDKVIKAAPPWLVPDANADFIPDACPGCGAVPDHIAAICKGCGYVFKPVAAYGASLIEYGHISMDRLTAEEWREVNGIKEKRDEARSAGALPANARGRGKQQEEK